MTSTSRWWLRLAGLGTVALGLGLAGLAASPAGQHALFQLAGLDAPATPALSLSCGIMGGLTAALGWLIAKTADAPALAPHVLGALAWWYVIDSGVSALVAPPNVLANTALLLVALPPLLRVARSTPR